ncbi:MAG TPA: hypothetical protein VK760_09530, partial [Candidatus Acidoferrales bacterium]|nr:hypothetical protein [Candidatus Acidoferrales bacterium]
MTQRGVSSQKMLVFARGVSGNAAPSKRLRFSKVYAATAAGKFWAMGPAKGIRYQPGLYSASGALIAALPSATIGVRKDGSFYTLVATYSGIPEECIYVGNVAIDTYRLRDGKPTLVSSLTLAKPCNVAAVAAGPDGSLYVATSSVAAHSDDPQTTRVLHFAPGAIGNAKPVSRVYSTYEGGASNTQLAVDSRGNLYLALNGRVRVYRNGRSPGTYLFDGDAVAIDSQDNVYVVASAYNKTALRTRLVVREYAPGATTPFRTIDGSNTELHIGDGGQYPTIALVP